MIVCDYCNLLIHITFNHKWTNKTTINSKNIVLKLKLTDITLLIVFVYTIHYDIVVLELLSFAVPTILI